MILHSRLGLCLYPYFTLLMKPNEKTLTLNFVSILKLGLAQPIDVNLIVIFSILEVMEGQIVRVTEEVI